jgi:hypothetical protein
MALTGNEQVYVCGIAENGQLAATLEPVTTAEIAALGGGGGLTNSVTITSGNTISAALETIYIWHSVTSGPKTMNAPPATGSLDIIEAGDAAGDAGSGGQITLVPNGSDVVIGNQNQVYTDFGSARWRDVAVGVWMNV